MAHCPTCRPALLTNLSVPFKYDLGSLQCGTVIKIKGVVNSLADRFVINFETSEDVAFHFNIRLDSNCIVKNTKIRGSYKKGEIDNGTNISTNEAFEIFFLVDKTHFKSSVNGVHVPSYSHILPITDINTLHIYENGSAEGFLNLHSVHVHPFIESSTISGGCVPCINPHVPFTMNIPGGLYPGRIIRIIGTPIGDDKFTINFHVKDSFPEQKNIALHFDVRFAENCVVRNSNDGNGWMKEERKQSNFPFIKGELFEIEIKVESNHYDIYVNGIYYTRFNHRHAQPEDVATLAVLKSVLVNQISFL